MNIRIVFLFFLSLCYTPISSLSCSIVVPCARIGSSSNCSYYTFLMKQFKKLSDIVFFSSKDYDSIKYAYFELRDILAASGLFITFQCESVELIDDMLHMNSLPGNELVVRDNILAPKTFWNYFDRRVQLLFELKMQEVDKEILARINKEKEEEIKKKIILIPDPRSVCKNSEELELLKKIFQKEEDARKGMIVKWFDQEKFIKKMAGL